MTGASEPVSGGTRVRLLIQALIACLAIAFATFFSSDACAQQLTPTTPGQPVLISRGGGLSTGRVERFDGPLAIVRDDHGNVISIDPQQLTVRHSVGDRVLVRNSDGSTAEGVVSRLEPDGSAVVLTTEPNGGMNTRTVRETDLSGRGAPYVTTPMNPEYRGENDPATTPKPGWDVTYLTDAQRAQYQVHVKDGLLVDATGRPLDTRGGSIVMGPQGEAIFVMDGNGNIYVSKHQAVGEFHHSSLLAGQNVAAAGTIRVENGHIVMITNSSGHYRPGQWQTIQAIDSLSHQGYDVRGVRVGDISTGGATVVREAPPGAGPRPPPLVQEEPDGREPHEPDSRHSHVPKIPKAGVVGLVIGVTQSVGNTKHEYDRIRTEGGSVPSALVHAGGQVLDGLTLGIGPATKTEYDRSRNNGDNMLVASLHGAGQTLDKLTVGIGPAAKTEYERSRNSGGNMLVASLHGAGQALDILTLGAGPKTKSEYDRSRNSGGNMLVASLHGGGQVLDTLTLGVGPTAKQKYDQSRNGGDNMLVSTGKAALAGLGNIFGF